MGVAQVAGPIPLGAGCDPSLNYTAMSAGVAQLVAHPTCNRAVRGSSPRVGSDVSAGQSYISRLGRDLDQAEIGRLSQISHRSRVIAWPKASPSERISAACTCA